MRLACITPMLYSEYENKWNIKLENNMPNIFLIMFGQKSIPARLVEIVADNIETANKEAYSVFGAAGWASSIRGELPKGFIPSRSTARYQTASRISTSL